jgi:hypothetical protein
LFGNGELVPSDGTLSEACLDFFETIVFTGWRYGL